MYMYDKFVSPITNHTSYDVHSFNDLCETHCVGLYHWCGSLFVLLHFKLVISNLDRNDNIFGECCVPRSICINDFEKNFHSMECRHDTTAFMFIAQLLTALKSVLCLAAFEILILQISLKLRVLIIICKSLLHVTDALLSLGVT